MNSFHSLAPYALPLNGKLLDPNAHSIARDAPMLMKVQGGARDDQGSNSTEEEAWKRRKKKEGEEQIPGGPDISNIRPPPRRATLRELQDRGRTFQ